MFNVALILKLLLKKLTLPHPYNWVTLKKNLHNFSIRPLLRNLSLSQPINLKDVTCNMITEASAILKCDEDRRNK